MVSLALWGRSPPSRDLARHTHKTYIALTQDSINQWWSHLSIRVFSVTVITGKSI